MTDQMPAPEAEADRLGKVAHDEAERLRRTEYPRASGDARTWDKQGEWPRRLYREIACAVAAEVRRLDAAASPTVEDALDRYAHLRCRRSDFMALPRGMCPGDDEIADARRVLFTAMTRDAERAQAARIDGLRAYARTLNDLLYAVLLNEAPLAEEELQTRLLAIHAAQEQLAPADRPAPEEDDHDAH